MFLLKDLPDNTIFKKFKGEYPELDERSTSLFLRLLRVGSDLLNKLDDYLRPFELSHGRWITLVLLHRNENNKALPSQLAEKQGVTRATMTNLLVHLEKQGFVRRVACDVDGRSVHVELTSKGKAVLDEVMPGYYRMVKDLFSPFNNQSIDKTIALLDDLRTYLEDI